MPDKRNDEVKGSFKSESCRRKSIIMTGEVLSKIHYQLKPLLLH